MNAGASLSAVPSPIEGSGTAWVLLGSWALSPARPTPIPPRHECRGFSALLVIAKEHGDMTPLLRLGRGEVEFCRFHTAGFPQGYNEMPMLGSDGILDLFIIV